VQAITNLVLLNREFRKKLSLAGEPPLAATAAGETG
jgi:hypothetical protein